MLIKNQLNFHPIDAYILMGGKSKRFGSDKALHKINNVSFKDRIYKVLNHTFRNVFFVDKESPDNNEMVIKDLYSAQTPLAGLITVLNHAKSEWVFIISVDMPFVTNSVIDEICSHLDGQHSLIIPQLNSNLLPLCGVYEKSLLPIFQDAFDRSEYRIKKIISEINHKILSLDSYELELSNINNKSDLVDIMKKFKENRI